MNELVGKSCPGHGSRIHIVSLDVFSYVELLDKSQWSEAVEFLLEGVGRLVKSGIDFLLICSNTSKFLYRQNQSINNQIILLGHIAAPKIAGIYPDLVFIHIGDAVAVSAKQKKLKKVRKLFVLISTDRLFVVSLDFWEPSLLWYQIVVSLNV